ncbi:MAG: hypothetical protein F2839_03560 [Actinobacteria bacterium]|uniref:Unannotated protein n=1 Tax=freshwater metagenome TaxID=449393 RepID=A0A6J5Z8K8_9ZZZZ|nr:hypothetical protein [Actinomycetota bacterium]
MSITFARLGNRSKTHITHEKSTAMWRDLRLWVGLSLICISVIAANIYMAAAAQRTIAYVATHEIASGTIIRSSDVQPASVSLPVGVAPVAQLSDVVGRTLSQDAFAGEIIFLNSLESRSQTFTRIMSVPIRAGHLPEVRHGAGVEIWMTPSLDGAEVPGPPVLIVERAIIVDAPAQVDPSMDTAVTIQVADTEVSTVVKAMRDGVLDVVLTTTESSAL